MRVRSLITLSFFAASAIAADNTPPVASVKPVQDNLSIRKLFASDQMLLRTVVETSSPTSINTRVRTLSAVVAHKANNDINGITTAHGPSRDFWLQIRGARFLTT